MYQDLKLSDRARIIEMAVKSGIRDLNTIEQVYNTFENGGEKEDTYKKVIENRFPIAKSYNYHIYPDKEVSNGYGDIETFAGDWAKDTVHYNNGFNLNNRYPGETSIVFNPDKVTDEDIALDALHIAREQDPVYQMLLKKYEDEAVKTHYEDFRGDGPEEDFHNGVDGVLRGSMYQGDRVKARYAPAEEYEWLYKTYPELGNAYKDIFTYLNSGYIEPAVVTANYKRYYPKGNTFDDGGYLEGEGSEKKSKFNKPVSWYVSQRPELYPNINKISPENLDKYFFIDDSGTVRSRLARDRYASRKQELQDSLGKIGYNQDNEIMLTTDAANARYRTGRISTDILDYIYDNAAKAGIPFRDAVGLAGKESTLGIGRGYKRGQSISPINLYSYWAGIGAGARSNYQMKKLDQIYKQFYSGEQIDMDALAKAETEYQKLYDNLHEFQGNNLVKAAYDYYKAGKYNPGEEGYDADVIRQGDAILSDKAVQKWLKTKKSYTGRGFCYGGRLATKL